MALGDGTKRKHTICTSFSCFYFFLCYTLAFLPLTLSVFTISSQTTLTVSVFQFNSSLFGCIHIKSLFRSTVKAIFLNVGVDVIAFKKSQLNSMFSDLLPSVRYTGCVEPLQLCS